MIRLIASGLAGALSVGAAGYSYVNNLNAEVQGLRAQTVTLQASVDRKNSAIDTAIKTLAEGRK
jgi:hypothetical protein